MNIVYSWLKEMIADAPSVEVLEEQLAGLGLETDAIVRIPQPHANVVMAKIVSIEAIEGKSIRKCMVDIGLPEPIQLITGAPNAYEGMGFALAKPGTVLPDGLELGTRKFGQLESFGMGLSAKELGFGDYSGGLMDLPLGELALGASLNTVWKEDWVLQVEITPNRPDWLSVLGVARDLRALGYSFADNLTRPATSAALALPCSAEVHTELCSRFTLSYAEGLTVQPSPLLVQQRLYAAGMRPISNVVDATNYVMLERGNPMHAFDASKVHNLSVRAAQQGETITVLDGKTLELTPNDMVVASNTAVALAGVMGGANAEVSATTTAIALEVAHFDPVTVRKSAKRHGYKTEASYRFERGVDYGALHHTADRLLSLLQQWNPAVQVAAQRIDINRTAAPKPIAFSVERAVALLGMPLTQAQCHSIFERLGCAVTSNSEQVIAGVTSRSAPTGGSEQVTPPTYRVDLHIEQDLIEEVARVVGYEHIPVRLPGFFAADDNLGAEAPYQAREQLKTAFVGAGFQEVINYSWTSEAECELFKLPKPTVAMINPQTPERTMLRTSLLAGLVRNLRQGLDQSEAGPYMLFEMGNVFNATEQTHVAALLHGHSVVGGWQAGLAGDFYALKGLLVKTLEGVGLGCQVQPAQHSSFHPGVCGQVLINGQAVGHIGALHPAIAESMELGQVLLLELSLPLPQSTASFADVAKFPASSRDLAAVVPEAVPFATIEALAWEHGGPLLESVSVFDVYRGKPIEPGFKNLAFNMVFRSSTSTLTQEQTDSHFNAVIAAVEAAGYGIRKA